MGKTQPRGSRTSPTSGRPGDVLKEGFSRFSGKSGYMNVVAAKAFLVKCRLESQPQTEDSKNDRYNTPYETNWLKHNRNSTRIPRPANRDL